VETRIPRSSETSSGRLGGRFYFRAGERVLFFGGWFGLPRRADVVHHAVHQDVRARARAAHHRPFGVLVPQRNGVARRRRVTLRLSGQREVGYEPFDDGLDVNIQSTGDWLAQSS